MTVSIEVHLTADYLSESLRRDVKEGLTSTPKSLPPKWFYDAEGSVLFEKITALPEYYPFRAEREILAERASEIAATTRARTLIELGSGSSEKTRLLLDALREAGTLHDMVPLDVSETALREAADTLAADYPGLRVHGVVADFTAHMDRVEGDRPRLVAFLGSTIGNLLPDERARFLSEVRDVLDAGEWLLLGADLVKSPEALLCAYDDAQGVTAEFNRNVLRVLNRELGADFLVSAFEHVAVWDPEREWIEMRLRATEDMAVTVPELGLDVRFAEGEEMRTEISTKFRREVVEGELAKAGFEQTSRWTDAEGRFSLVLARAV
ncbi:MAG: L-histidine N(alpha)-methyltransferase [Actinophytocola sp.]|nr:L-histidine N(alpha)-methyltransferase [Actinophytocola sp.]